MTDQSQQHAIKQMFETDPLGSSGKCVSTDGKYMSLQEASNQTGFSMGTLRRYIKAKKLKARRQGRSLNSKLEVWVTADMLAGNSELTESLEEDENDVVVEDSEDDYSDNTSDQPDQSLATTLNWMQRKLDEKDDALREKEAKIEKLMQELTGASYRNGYLEAQHKELETRVLLLEDQSAAESAVQERAETEVPTQKEGTWQKFCSWFMGKGN